MSGFSNLIFLLNQNLYLLKELCYLPPHYAKCKEIGSSKKANSYCLKTICLGLRKGGT